MNLYGTVLYVYVSEHVIKEVQPTECNNWFGNGEKEKKEKEIL